MNKQPLDYVPKPRYEERPLPQSSGVLGPQNFEQDNSQGECQFGCGILKMVGPKMQDFFPRINMLKGNCFKTILR